MADRKKLKSANGLYLGSTGSGKSFAAKRELLNVFLAIPQDRIIVVDPMGEYAPLVERLPDAGMKLAMQQGQTLPPVEGLALYPQPLEVADHVRLYTFQTGPCGGHIFSRDAKGDLLGPFYAVVAFCDLVFQHPRGG